MAKLPKKKKGLEDRIREEYQDFYNEVVGLSPELLDKRLAGLAKGLDEAEEFKKNDAELEDAKAEVKKLSGPHNDAKKEITLKSKYVIYLLKEKGAL